MARGNRGENAALDDFIGDFAATPVRNGSGSLLRSFTGEGNDLAAVLGADLDWASGAGYITETFFEGKVGKGNGSKGEPAVAPAADGIDIKVEEAGDLGVIGAISSSEDDASTQGKLLRERMATQQGIELLANIGSKLHRWRFWTSHSDNSQF